MTATHKPAIMVQPVSFERYHGSEFDRPALYTSIHQESNLPDSKRAITDTIQALGTGIWKARDGQVIGRLVSRHQLKDAEVASHDRAYGEGDRPNLLRGGGY